MPSDRRGKDPNSLKNLRPIKPGETLNPTGINAKHPVTDEYRVLGPSPLPERIRNKLNLALGTDYLKPGATWNQANALRRYMEAVMSDGGAASSKELREAQEGKVMQRLEIAAGLAPAPAAPPSITLIGVFPPGFQALPNIGKVIDVKQPTPNAPGDEASATAGGEKSLNGASNVTTPGDNH
jgi:hypothetical protein